MRYVCTVCGYVFDEEAEGKSFAELTECPICMQPASVFKPEEGQEAPQEAAPAAEKDANPLAYDPAYARRDETCRYMAEIHDLAVNGRSIGAAMSTKMPMAGWDDVLLMGAQLDPAPMDDDFDAHTMIVIGKHAAKPMLLDMPVYISHMSFGALSAEIKEALAKGSAMAKTAMCSGEGGILPAEKAAAYKYIFEYIPNKYSVTDENLKSSDAI